MAVKVGAMSSTRTTVIVKEPVAVFPWLSVAVQFTVVPPTGKLFPEGGSQASATFGSALSEAETEYVTIAPMGTSVSTEKELGTSSTGFVWSTKLTVTVNKPVSEFPCASVAVQVTVVVPTSKFDPDARSQVIAGFESRLSVAVTV